MSDPIVYDKAKYHYGGDFPAELPMEQAFVHTGLYLGWIMDRGLYSEFFATSASGQVDDFRARRITGPDVYEWWDGCLVADMLSDEGNAFSRHYFDFEHGRYLRDYEELLLNGAPTLYHVRNTWENYDRLAKRIDERFAEWKRGPRPWWKLW